MEQVLSEREEAHQKQCRTDKYSDSQVSYQLKFLPTQNQKYSYSTVADKYSDCQVSQQLKFLPTLNQKYTKVPILKEVNFGKVKLWDVEHFWTDFDLSKWRDRTHHAIC